MTKKKNAIESKKKNLEEMKSFKIMQTTQKQTNLKKPR